jgi:hypothetical protein
MRVEIKLTGSIEGEVEPPVIAAVRGRKRDIVRRFDAGVSQPVVSGVLIRSKGCGEVETGRGGTVGQLSVPLARAGLAGKDGCRSGSGESEDNSGELHLDGNSDGVEDG